MSDVAKQSKAPRNGVRMKHDTIYASYIIIHAMTGSHFSRACLNSWNVTPRAHMGMLGRVSLRVSKREGTALGAEEGSKILMQKTELLM